MIYQSIRKYDGSMIFCFDLAEVLEIYANPITYLNRMLECVDVIEKMHPHDFRFRFNGISIEIMAQIPCHKSELTSVFGRYGGPLKFNIVLKKYLASLLSTNLNIDTPPSMVVHKSILKVGSRTYDNGYNSTYIESSDTPVDIIKKSKRPLNYTLKDLDMKFWIKHLNPDVIDYKKKPVIRDPIEVDYEKYPPCISQALALKYKPPKIRNLIMKFLLLSHKREEAKRVLLSCLTQEEAKKLEFGTLEERWTYAVNNLDNNSEPTCEQLRKEGLCTECGKICPYEVEENDKQTTN